MSDNENEQGISRRTLLGTTAAAAGGTMRGDCDDVAELYQVIAERQRRPEQPEEPAAQCLVGQQQFGQLRPLRFQGLGEADHGAQRRVGIGRPR